MKKLFAYHALMRMLSILALLALFIIRIALARSGRFDLEFCLDLLFESLVLANVVLGMYPDEMQNLEFSCIFAAGTVVFTCIAGVFGKSSICALTMLLIYLLIISFGPLSKLKVCFRNDSIWSLFENYASCFYICCFLILSCLFSNVSALLFKTLLLFFLALLFIIRYLSAYTGWTFLVSKSRELQIKRSINGFLRGVPVSDIPDEKKLHAVYERVVKTMESEKPYLDPDYDMRDLVERTFSNKTYISRAINYYSGKNFRQFLNYYRVQYSIELMKEDHSLTVTELACRCGFHSTVSYNLAFKLVMNNTPSSYCRDFIIE